MYLSLCNYRFGTSRNIFVKSVNNLPYGNKELDDKEEKYNDIVLVCKYEKMNLIINI